MLISQVILNWFCSNFEFYIARPLLTTKLIPSLQISIIKKIYDTEVNLDHSKSQPLQMPLSRSILKGFVSNFGFYIKGPILKRNWYGMKLERSWKLKHCWKLELSRKCELNWKLELYLYYSVSNHNRICQHRLLIYT